MPRWLLDRMVANADRPALVRGGGVLTYGGLLDRVAAWGTEFDRAGVGRGQVLAIDGDFTSTAIGCLLAAMDRGAVVVPLTAAFGGAQREEFLEIAQVAATVTISEDDAWAMERRPGAGRDHPLLATLRERGHPGLILFTSGSTGRNKAALHDLHVLLEKFESPRSRMCTLTFLLLDHIGGLNTLFYTLANGGTVVSVAGRDPDEILAAVARHRVQLLPTTPSFLNLALLSGAFDRHDVSSLVRITYGTEVMPARTLERLRERLPGVDLLQTYGLTEVGILRSKSKEAGSLLVRVGGEGYQTKVVDGILWVKARSAMLGYLNAPSPFDADGWFCTQDAVEQEGEFLRILGRTTDIINVGGQKVYPGEVESVLLELANVRDATVHGEPNALLGQVVAARLNLLEPEPPAELRRRVRAHCQDRLAAYKIPVRIEVAEQDPYNARFKKLRRD